MVVLFIVGSPFRESLKGLRLPLDPNLCLWLRHHIWRAYPHILDSPCLQAGMKEFIKGGGDSEFDGGDSGGGVVGDGNTDLEDQHNSPSVVRGGFGQAAPMADRDHVGRGKVKSAVDSKIASAGANYFGRSTGYAEEKMQQITEETLRSGKLDAVRAQQFENWFNQRAIHKQNREQGQGVVYGERKEGGHYIAREALESQAWRSGAQEGEISQRDLAKHLENLRTLPAQRLDGQEWGALTISPSDPVEATYEVRAAAKQTSVTEIQVKNDFNTFAPYRVLFTADSSPEFDVSPTAGTLNRRSGEPLNLIVRFTPQTYGEPRTATLVVETEDMKKIYTFVGST
mmetsp:Transcript_32437/g.62457  ORF Transcript_32437/g.62457 Transcript_32437/m.62457 type:complete len:342 (-) Transcript_32437:370-1395(-)